MPFTSYATYADVATAHRIQCRRAKFLEPVAALLGDYFRSELAFTLKEVPFDRSESAACETLIYPLLREVWKPFREALTLWSHEALTFDDDLCGVPDYMVSRRSPLGPFIPDQPYLLVVEAKRDDFVRAWGQCLAAMLAAQRLGGLEDETVYGASTNGRAWEFGQLRGGTFTQDSGPYGLNDIDELAGAIHFLMIQCRDLSERMPVSA